jgi:predicted trehalose synthase
MLAGTYATEAYGLQNAKMAQMPTIQQRIDLAVQQAEDRLAAVKRAKELFEKNPDLEELLNIMQRAHF